MNEPPGSKVIAFPGDKIQIVLLPKVLGKGMYGSVHHCYQRGNPNLVYAVKVIERKKLKGKSHEYLMNEITIMQEMRAVNVVSLISATKTQSNYYLVMEYCNGGDLEGFIRARGGYLTEPEAKVILRQIVNGLKEIKEQKVMHRDLKLANILVNFPNLTKEEQESPGFNLKEYIKRISFVPSKNGEQPTEIVIKIADLGFARKLN